MREATTTRRDFVRMIPMGIAAVAGLRPSRLDAMIRHPDPRPGIDGSGVLTAADLPGFGPDVHEIYDMIREIPEVADGIGCGCGCAALPHYRSLLTCFHERGMAMGCQICQGEAKLVYGRHQEGQSLDQIRRAIDARYG